MDFGYGDGALLLKLKRDKDCREIYGIEVKEYPCDGLLDKTWHINLDDESAELGEEYNNYFSYIISSNVLEHVYDPWYVLSKLRQYLAPSGKMILEVPNVQCWESLYRILAGEFPYTSGAHFDFTHIRWYTLKSFTEMLGKVGLEPVVFAPENQRRIYAAYPGHKGHQHTAASASGNPQRRGKAVHHISLQYQRDLPVILCASVRGGLQQGPKGKPGRKNHERRTARIPQTHVRQSGQDDSQDDIRSPSSDHRPKARQELRSQRHFSVTLNGGQDPLGGGLRKNPAVRIERPDSQGYSRISIYF